MLWGWGRDTNDYTAVPVQPRNDRALSRTEVMEREVGPMRHTVWDGVDLVGGGHVSEVLP